MPILCVDGEISDLEMLSWNILPLRTSVALTCDEIRAAFVGKPLARGLALLRFNRAQLARLFPGRSQRKAAYHLTRFARRIQGERARATLANASWHQLRAAAVHTDEDAQIGAAVTWIMGIRGRRQLRSESSPQERV